MAINKQRTQRKKDSNHLHLEFHLIRWRGVVFSAVTTVVSYFILGIISLHSGESIWRQARLFACTLWLPAHLLYVAVQFIHLHQGVVSERHFLSILHTCLSVLHLNIKANCHQTAEEELKPPECQETLAIFRKGNPSSRGKGAAALTHRTTSTCKSNTDRERINP